MLVRTTASVLGNFVTGQVWSTYYTYYNNIGTYFGQHIRTMRILNMVYYTVYILYTDIYKIILLCTQIKSTYPWFSPEDTTRKHKTSHYKHLSIGHPKFDTQILSPKRKIYPYVSVLLPTPPLTVNLHILTKAPKSDIR